MKVIPNNSFKDEFYTLEYQYSLIQDLQRMKQLSNEFLSSFSAKLQSQLAKIIAAVTKQNLTAKEKQAQIELIEPLAPNTLPTPVEVKIAQIFWAS